MYNFCSAICFSLSHVLFSRHFTWNELLMPSANGIVPKKIILTIEMTFTRLQLEQYYSVSFLSCKWLTQTCFYWEAGSLAVSCFSNIACNTPVVSFIRFLNIRNLKYSLIQDNQSTRWVQGTSIFLPCYCGRWNIMTCFTRKPCYWSNSYCCIFGILKKFPGDTCS